MRNLFDSTAKLEEHLMDVGIVATHISPAKGYGGVAVTARVLTRAWAEVGHKIRLVVSDESIDGRLKKADLKLGDNVDADLYRCYWFRRWGFGFGAIPKIMKLCAKAPVVYIHGIATWPCTLAAMFCVIFRKRFMVAVHGGLMPEHVKLIRKKKPHKWLFYKLLTFPTLRRAVAVHCTSETEVEGVRDALGRDARIIIVPNGIDSREVTPAGIPAGEGMTLCFLGHIQQEKGINAFIRGWLKTRQPTDRLLVAGRGVDGSYFKDFESLVAQAQGAIDYRGYVSREEVMGLLANSHFLVLPSGLEETGGMRENFGNVVAEALASGRPVLVARGLAWDDVESVGAGMVFDRTEASLCKVLNIARLLSESEWRNMSSHARNYVVKHFDSVILSNQVWQVLTCQDFGGVSSKSREGAVL
jgi:glycosyltransferase involved in cell wall biosynthesis